METLENKGAENPSGEVKTESKPSVPTVPPKTWLVESILVTLFCCMPFGIVGIVYAAMVESRFYAGQYDAALQASQTAGKWTKIGFWVGLACIVLSIIAYAILIAMGIALDEF